MAITSGTISAVGVGSPFDYTGGAGTALVTGNLGGGTTYLEYSLDDTAYGIVGSIEAPGGFNFNLPACKLRWVHKGDKVPSLVTSVETNS